MSVMKVIELMAESDKSWEDATRKAIQKAAQTVKNIRSAYVKDHSVTIKNGDIATYRVTLKVTFEVS